MVDKFKLPSQGRFSSQLLTLFGAKDNSTIGLLDISNRSQLGVVGSCPPDWYNSTICYFLSRGSSKIHAETMTGLVVDASTYLGITPSQLLENLNSPDKFSLSDVSMAAMNQLRNLGNQLSKAIPVDNRNSLRSREIRG